MNEAKRLKLFYNIEEKTFELAKVLPVSTFIMIVERLIKIFANHEIMVLKFLGIAGIVAGVVCCLMQITAGFLVKKEIGKKRVITDTMEFMVLIVTLVLMYYMLYVAL